MAEMDKADIADVPIVNQTRASEGYRGNTAFGSLLEAFGTGIKQGTEAAYQGTVGYVRQDLTKEVDRVRSDYGVDAAVDAKTGLDNKKVLPQELNDAGDRLQMLNDAYKAGTLRESNYRAQLELTSRQMRYRYPGFREEIDGIMSNLTGSVPANALVHSLREEALAKHHTDEDSEAKRLGRMEDKAAEEGVPMPPGWTGPGTVSLGDFQKHYNNESAKKYNNAAIQDDIKTKGDQRGERSGAATDALNVRMKQEIGSIFDTQIGMIAKDSAQLKSTLSKMQSGQKLNPDEMTAANAMLGRIRAQVNERKAAIKLEYAPLLKSDQIDGILSNMDARVNNFEDDLHNQRTGLLNFHANAAKIETDATKYDLLKNAPGFGTLAATKDALGPQLSDFVLRNAQLTKGLEQYLVGKATDELVTPDTPVGKILDDVQRNKGASKESLDAILNIAKTITAHPDTPSKATGIVLDNLYSDGVNLLARAPSDKKGDFVLQMSSPGYIQALQTKLKNGDISQDQWNKYKTWLQDTATTALRIEASTANQMKNTRQYVTLQYNPKTFTLDTVPRPDAPARTFISGTIEKGLEKEAQGSVDQVNRMLMGLANMYKAEGTDPNTELPQMIEKMGIFMNQQRQPTQIESVWSLMQEAAKKPSATLEAIKQKAAKEETVRETSVSDEQKRIAFEQSLDLKKITDKLVPEDASYFIDAARNLNDRLDRLEGTKTSSKLEGASNISEAKVNKTFQDLDPQGKDEFLQLSKQFNSYIKQAKIKSQQDSLTVLDAQTFLSLSKALNDKLDTLEGIKKPKETSGNDFISMAQQLSDRLDTLEGKQ